MDGPDEDKIEGLAIVLTNPEHVGRLLFDLLRYKRAFFKTCAPFQPGDRIRAAGPLFDGRIKKGTLGNIDSIDYVAKGDGTSNWDIVCTFDGTEGHRFGLSWGDVIFIPKAYKIGGKQPKTLSNRQKRLSRGRKR